MKNEKRKQVSEVKDKGKLKTTFSSPVESPICWPDKSIFWTRLISLVLEDSLATSRQKKSIFL